MKNSLHHRKFHLHINKLFDCGFDKCLKQFLNATALGKHLIKVHGISSKRNKISNHNTCYNEFGKFICTVEICRQECESYRQLIKHLKDHLRRHEQIMCPYKRCRKKYINLNSFTSHLTKNHRKFDETCIVDESKISHCVPSEINSNNAHIDIDFSWDNIENDFSNDSDDFNLFLNNMTQFYLKLESEFLLPASTIQYISQANNDLHSLAQDTVINNLKTNLEATNVSPEIIGTVIKALYENHSHPPANELLKSNYKRKHFFKNSLHFVQPESIEIDKEKKTFFSYVPIEKTITNMFSDKTLINSISFNTINNNANVIEDFTDGSIYKNNEFFQNNKDKRIQIIMYQDELEIVNPIGPAKKCHKILAVYMTIGNIAPHLRSHVNNIKLVALCKVKDFNHQKVFGKIVDDLINIEERGVKIGNELINGSLVYISGDNLGSHALGGFAENFSKVNHICRYCLMTKDEFYAHGGACKFYKKRTKGSYESAVAEVNKKNIIRKLTNRKNKTKKNIVVEGIKFSSEFNRLKHFHMIKGLPPCLGHDFFEGIVCYDLKPYVDYFINKGWITLDELNKIIENFPYSSH